MGQVPPRSLLQEPAFLGPGFGALLLDLWEKRVLLFQAPGFVASVEQLGSPRKDREGICLYLWAPMSPPRSLGTGGKLSISHLEDVKKRSSIVV